MNIEEEMMPIDEWNKQFSCKYMQQPISFLTEEILNKLEQHCEKTIQYGNGRILEEHQVTLELIIRYRELQQELEKEKEKNKDLKWKPIKDYDRKKYDWVLVKYFDGDYECIPEVAEKRSDGKWYTSERQIPFEVKYFFDMQEILEEE